MRILFFITQTAAYIRHRNPPLTITLSFFPLYSFLIISEDTRERSKISAQPSGDNDSGKKQTYRPNADSKERFKLSK